ncbi:MAG: hypothetical protein Q8Q94_01415 [bacterium]|nr:hypothetical protein [bacterium]
MRLSANELGRMLKESLDDPAITTITDERLLVGGLLDSLLAESSDYAACYRNKAQRIVLHIYQEIRCGKRIMVPRGLWRDEQGLLNVGLVLRSVITQQGWTIDRFISEEYGKGWIEQHGLASSVFGHGLYKVLISAYPEYAFDPKRPTAFHLHPWDLSRVRIWREQLIKKAVRHTVHFHMPWGLGLRELVERFTLEFLKRENLGSLVNVRFSANPYRLFVFGFPEYEFDPTHPNCPHIHPWDAAHTPWSDDLIREAVRHMVKYHTDWRDEELAANVTVEWINKVGIGGPLATIFSTSRLRLLEFVYPELFEQGILSEEFFHHLQFGFGVGRFRHPLRLVRDKKPQVWMQAKCYYFPHHHGCLVHKLTQEYGAIYTPDKQLVALFKWNTDPNTKYINIGEKDLEPIPPELTQSRRHLAFAEAVRVLADEVRIVVHALPLRDQTALTGALNTVEPAQVVDYLKLTGGTGLRAMADTEFCSALILVHELFDNPAEFRQVLVQYNGINAKLAAMSMLFTRRVTTIPDGTLKAFRTELHAKLFDASDRIVNALSQALIYPDRATRDILIADVLQAQRDFVAITEVLDAFGQDALRLVRQQTYQDGTRDLHYIYNGASLATGVDIYLVLRPRQNPRGQARIGFRIAPHSPVGAGISHELSLRWDRETTTQTALDIHSEAFVRLGRLDRRQFPRGYHYAVSGSEFAEIGFFEKIVQGFLPM